MNYLPFLFVVLVVVGLIAYSARARRRQASAEADRRAAIAVGTEVMTTSGLYGTVVSLDGDEAVRLAIAPGVEVRWAMSALRPVQSLPDRYREDAGAPERPAGAGSTG